MQSLGLLSLHNHYLHFPVRGRKLGHSAQIALGDLIIIYISPLGDGNGAGRDRHIRNLHYHYLHFPVRGRKLAEDLLIDDEFDGSLFTFPRKGTETVCSFLQCFQFCHHYLHFPVRGRKLRTSQDSMFTTTSHHYLHFPVRGRKQLSGSFRVEVPCFIIIYISP